MRHLLSGTEWLRTFTDHAAIAIGRASRATRWPARFDILPLLICTDGAVLRFARDLRRLRPNLVIGGVTGTAERHWPGATLRLPHAEIQLADLRGRCVMTTYDPDTALELAGAVSLLRSGVVRIAADCLL